MSKKLLQHDTYAYFSDNIWNVRSIDTMKTSRDLARSQLYNPSFDKNIEKEVKLIKDLGATHVAINTPYDPEFLPYLKRWVKIARENNLNVWYRGGFSGYEGWFDYPKDVSTDEMLTKTQEFISLNDDLFENGDIFDPCPECENGGYFPQPQKNNEYNQFLIKKNNLLKDSFTKINKDVTYNWNSIIGGRAKEVVNEQAFNNLGRVVALDHYAPDPFSYTEYINYFNDRKVNTVFSEFGAPIPDMHGEMSEVDQAEFIEELLNIFYRNKENVKGLNYWVMSNGTTELFNKDLTPRLVAKILKNYYSPGIIKGNIKNSAGDSLENITIKTADGYSSVKTDKNGHFKIVIPAGKTSILVGSEMFNQKSLDLILDSGKEYEEDFIIEPKKKDFMYNLRLRFNKIF